MTETSRRLAKIAIGLVALSVPFFAFTLITEATSAGQSDANIGGGIALLVGILYGGLGVVVGLAWAVVRIRSHGTR